jgi:hypothetical protein
MELGNRTRTEKVDTISSGKGLSNRTIRRDMLSGAPDYHQMSTGMAVGYFRESTHRKVNSLVPFKVADVHNNGIGLINTRHGSERRLD